jgi:hypothetical protein
MSGRDFGHAVTYWPQRATPDAGVFFGREQVATAGVKAHVWRRRRQTYQSGLSALPPRRWGRFFWISGAPKSRSPSSRIRRAECKFALCCSCPNSNCHLPNLASLSRGWFRFISPSIPRPLRKLRPAIGPRPVIFMRYFCRLEISFRSLTKADPREPDRHQDGSGYKQPMRVFER